MASSTTKKVKIALNFFFRVSILRLFIQKDICGNLPEEESESNSSLIRAAKAIAAAPRGANHDGQGDRAGEPEEHGDGLQSERGELVEEVGHVQWCEADICEDEYRPDGIEEHKVRAVRACVADISTVVVAIVLADEESSQAELDNGEHDRHDMGDGDKAESHLWCGMWLWLSENKDGRGVARAW